MVVGERRRSRGEDGGRMAGSVPLRHPGGLVVAQASSIIGFLSPATHRFSGRRCLGAFPGGSGRRRRRRAPGRADRSGPGLHQVAGRRTADGPIVEGAIEIASGLYSRRLAVTTVCYTFEQSTVERRSNPSGSDKVTAVLALELRIII